MNQIKYNIMSQKVDYFEGLPLHFLKNVEVISKDGGVDRYFTETYFPIPYGKHYYHLMIDYLSGYLLLKKIYPDLKIIFVKTGVKKERSGTFTACDDLAEIYNAEIIDFCEENYFFEELLLLHVDVHVIPHQYHATRDTYTDDGSPEYVNFIKQAIPLLVEKIKPLTKLNGTQDKVWISRKKGSRRIESTNFEHEKTRRVHPNIYNEELEEEIKKLGWKVYDFEDMSFYDQINIVYNATKIGGFEGTCLINTLFSNSPMLVVQTNKPWDFQFIQKILFDKNNITVLDIMEDSPEIGFQKILTHLQI